ncbi:hypothetical protein Tco_0571297 [Tanacetum coccineum]
MKKYMLLKLDANNAKDPITPKIAHSKKKGKPSNKLTTRNLVDLFKEEDIEQQLQDSIKRNNANPSYQERRQSMEDTLSKFMSKSTKRHEENSNLIKEIRALTDATIQNQGASIKTLEIQIGKMSKVLQERGFGSLPSSTEANLIDQVKSISTTVEAYSYPICRIGSSQYTVSTGQNHTLMYETRQTTIPFPSRLNRYCYEEKRDHMTIIHRKASTLKLHINNNSIPRE